MKKMRIDSQLKVNKFAIPETVTVPEIRFGVPLAKKSGVGVKVPKRKK